MGGFLKFILITVLILWLFKKLGGFLLRVWVNRVTKRPDYQQYNESRTNSKNIKREEGEIFISKKKSPKDSQTDGMGDFVDYEEIE